MGFESTSIPLLPPGTTSRAKLPVVALTKDNAMNLDNEYGVDDFAAEIAAICEDPDTDVDDRFEFHGFHRPVRITRSEEEEDGMGEEAEEEDDSGSLYRMEALTSEVDTLMSSPSKASDNFLLCMSEGDEDDLEDLEETPIARKITVKGKVKVKEVVQVVGKGRYRKTKDANKTTVEKKTKGTLLQEMITAHNGGNKDPADQAPHGMVNSKSTGLHILLSLSP